MITLAVSYFEDSLDRKSNLKKFLNYWKKYPVIIDIEECDTFTPLMEVYNRIANRCNTEHIAFTDVDVYFDYDQLEKSIGVADFVNPFDTIYDVRDGIEVLQKKDDLHGKILGNISFERYAKTVGKNIDNQEKTRFGWNLDIDWNTPFFVGLCVLTKLETFYEFGMGNEYFKVWGGADDEWYARAITLGYSWKNVEGNIYHNYHGKSNVSSPRLIRNNMIELYKSISFEQDELKDYINSWPWVINKNRKRFNDNTSSNK